MDVIDVSLAVTPIGKGELELRPAGQRSPGRCEEPRTPFAFAEHLDGHIGALEKGFVAAFDSRDICRHGRLDKPGTWGGR
jgi:hypothetical protein